VSAMEEAFCEHMLGAQLADELASIEAALHAPDAELMSFTADSAWVTL